MIYGFSRNDVYKFLPQYLHKNILIADPFSTIDRRGVGSMIEAAVRVCKRANPNISIGISGRHTIDTPTLHFVSSIGVKYIICKPELINAARIAVSQASILRERT